jgi:hypothetical protein
MKVTIDLDRLLEEVRVRASPPFGGPNVRRGSAPGDISRTTKWLLFLVFGHFLMRCPRFSQASYCFRPVRRLHYEPQDPATRLDNQGNRATARNPALGSPRIHALRVHLSYGISVCAAAYCRQIA